MKPLSIQMYTLREQTKDGNHLPVLKHLAEIGYKGVEGHGYGMTATEFRKTVNDMGMEVSSYFGGVPTPETVNEFIDTAKELGVSDTVASYGPDNFATIEVIKQTAEELKTVVPAIHAAGLTFSLHNHWFEFEQRDGRLAIEWLLDEIPDITMELDIYWASNFGANVPEEMVAKFKDRVKLMHVKDGSTVREDPMTAVGSGSLDIPACIHAANPNWLIVELDACATDMLEAVENSYRYLVGNGLAAGNKPA